MLTTSTQEYSHGMAPGSYPFQDFRASLETCGWARSVLTTSPRVTDQAITCAGSWTRTAEAAARSSAVCW